MSLDTPEERAYPPNAEAATVEPPSAWYITREFVEKAPSNVDELHTYIGDGLSSEIKHQVAAPMEFWPPALKEVLGKSEGARDVIQEMVEKQTEMQYRVLQQYDRYHFALYRTQHERPGEDKPNPAKQRLTPDQLSERLKATQVALFWMGLEGERKVIDYLYEKAGAIPVHGMETEKIGTLPALPEEVK